MTHPGGARFGFEHLLHIVERYRHEADGPAAMDRRRVLLRLQRELAVEEALLLQRGFDKAYRRVVEGV